MKFSAINFLWKAPEYFSRWRVFPRAFITMYLLIVWETSQWFMALSEPTTQQAAFASSVLGIGAAWFGLYLQGPKFKAEELEHTSHADGSHHTRMGKAPTYKEEVDIKYEN